jgi:plasmid stabilization system protein ParE
VRRVIFTPAARAELIAAQDWYESEAAGLGRRFRLEVDKVVQRMADNPLQFPLALKTLRRARLHKFPYSLFFVVSDDALTVLACFHSSRDPQHWQQRT